MTPCIVTPGRARAALAVAVLTIVGCGEDGDSVLPPVLSHPGRRRHAHPSTRALGPTTPEAA